MSSMESRIIQSKAGYIINRTKKGNDLIKGVVKELTNNGSSKKNFEELQKTLEVNGEQLLNCQKEDLRKLVLNYDTRTWRKEMEKKSTLYIYRKRKEEIKEEPYENNKKSDTWFRAKSNCLPLGDRNREEATTCKLCGEEIEDLKHFMLNCEMLQHIRTRSILLQKPHINDNNEIIGKFLFDEERIEENRNIFYQMWTKRCKLIKDLTQTEGSA